MNKIGMGIDIGGSHITCQLFNLVDNIPIKGSLIRNHLDSHGSAESILSSWLKAIKQTAGSYEISSLAGIGFAMPGPFNYLNGVAWFKGVPKFESLYGIDVKTELKKQLNLPEEFRVRFLNDASSFAVGESWLGDAADYSKSISLTLGTGFGSTFIKNGLPVAGVDGLPEDGFLYHIPFMNSIADDYFSTRWFLNEYKEKIGKQVAGVKELVKLAPDDKTVQEIFSHFGNNLGVFLTPWILKYNPEAIILGGNISKCYQWFKDALETRFSSSQVDVIINISTMEEDAALAGSARLCDDNFYNQLIETKIIA